MSIDLRPVTLEDQALFDSYLRQAPHSLSAYAFENIIIWKPLFDISRAFIDGRLCVFFKNRGGVFLYLPPSGVLDADVLKKIFSFLEEMNHNRDVSRIENIEAADVGFFEKSGLRCYQKSSDYIVRRQEMVAYAGEKYKHKRNLRNFFLKSWVPLVRNYAPQDKTAVLGLAAAWLAERKARHSDPIYRAMLEDSQKVLEALLRDFQQLNYAGKIVEIDGRLRAFSCGFPVAPGLFCVNFEIADLSFKGLPQFIFSEFARALEPFAEINMMDDSGIENLRATKLSFHPSRLAPSFTALLPAE